MNRRRKKLFIASRLCTTPSTTHSSCSTRGFMRAPRLSNSLKQVHVLSSSIAAPRRSNSLKEKNPVVRFDAHDQVHGGCPQRQKTCPETSPTLPHLISPQHTSPQLQIGTR